MAEGDNIIFKIVDAGIWAEAEKAGKFTGAGVDIPDGFIHFSTREQSTRTAERFFHGKDNLVLVAVDISPIRDKIKWEKSGSGGIFPHLYEPLETSLAAWVKPLPLQADGSHSFEGLL